ncbi:MAG TPA: hypothetical protein VL475_07720 [Planctomycetaceae bacterium]|nr:hypothetical protein [Planctomycetaceae bacterium]
MSFDVPRQTDAPALTSATRRWLYLLVIVVAAVQGLASILTTSVLYSPARWPENRPPHTPLFSANDRSRWCTVWSLVERGTYEIDEIIRQPGWDTIDKVRYREHFYSSKPPHLSTLTAGLYWGLKRAAGLDLLAKTHETVHAILLVVNWLPWIVALALLAALVERFGRSDWSRLFVVVAAAFGTFLTTFLTTFNNHTVAATSVVFAIYPALGILLEGRRGWWRFALAGFWGAFAVCNELPACAFGAALFLMLVRKAPRETLAVFVPAALVPLGAFFYTNWLCTGGLMPFYASFGSAANDYYKYVFEGIPSYWMNPSAIDRGESSAALYFLHCTIGHHGIFSLSPIFLLTAAGWLTLRRNRSAPLVGVSLLGLVLTVWVLAFYLLQTKSYNYGGVTSGLRWSFWLIPLWLLGVVPVLDAWGHLRFVRIVSALALAVSVFSATFPHHNPWQQPWLVDWFPGGTTTPAANSAHPVPPRRIWLGPLPEPAEGAALPWVEFSGETGDGRPLVLRVALEAGADPALPTVSVSRPTAGPVAAPSEGALKLTVRPEAWNEGAASSAVLVVPENAPPQFKTEARRFLEGLPAPVEYKASGVRYLKTALRGDAFECRVGGASVLYRAQKNGPAFRHRRLVWWSPEIPFGVLQIEDTVTDPRDNSVVYRQRLQAVRTSGFVPRKTDAVERP